MEKGEYMVNTSERERTNIYCLVGQVMSIESPMLDSIYSCIKKLLRKLQDFRPENPQGEGVDYILKAHSAWTVFGFQQGTNMETNKSDDWLGAITISNYKAMWLVHGSQVIDMTRNKRKKEPHLVG
jgi:hypothetical protein